MPRENHCGECCCLKGNIEERACQLALYIIENKATVRSAAQRFGISKSTVHKDLSERLPAFNKPLYLQVKLFYAKGNPDGSLSHFPSLRRLWPEALYAIAAAHGYPCAAASIIHLSKF